MRNLIVALLCLFSASAAFGSPVTNKNALSLIKKIEQRRANLKNKLKAQSLIKILQPTTIRQGESYSLYFQTSTEITGTNALIDLSIDGLPVENLEQPALGLFIYHSSGEAEIKAHSAVAILSIEDAAEAKSIRDAIRQLDVEIQALQNEIDEMEPGEAQDALIQQQQEKVGIKNNLVAALASIKAPIGEEAFTFRILPALGNNPNFFRILTVSPSFGPVEGGTELTITGQRFPEGMEAILGGVSLPVTFISSTEVKITSPDYTASSGVGIKHLELRLPGATPQDPVKNATRNNVFYAANIETPPQENVKPVAVAGASQSVAMNAEVTVNGSGSYDQNANTTLSYEWRAVSVPADSGIDTGVVFANTESFNFTPSRPGSYVWELIVNDGELSSEPSLTVVTANPPENSVPQPSASNDFVLLTEQSATSQIFHGDADDYQAHSYLITRQSSFGNAFISSTGEITFTAGSIAGSDTIEVAVGDNGNPPLSGAVSIGVTVRPSNYAPVPSAPAIGAQPNVTVTAQVNHGDVDEEQTHTYAITQASAFGTASISSSGLITFEAGAIEGSDTLEVLVTDNGDPVLSGTVSIPVTVAISEVSIGVIVHDVVSNDGIIRVGLFAEPVASSNGEIVSTRWSFGDGTSGPSDDVIPNVEAYVQHDYMGPGTYPVTLTATDSLGATFTQSLNLVLGDTDVPVGRVTVDTISGAVPLTVNFDASASTSVSPINRYQWRWNDGSPNQNELIPTASHTFTEPGHYRVRLVLTNEARGRNGDSYVDIYAGIAPPLEGSRPIARFDLGAVELTLGSPHLFDGSWSFDPNPSGSIASYNWFFSDWANCGDGCYGTGVNPSHTYPVGNFWSRLEVTGAGGAVSEDIYRQVIVVNSGHAPRAVLNKPWGYVPLEGVAPFTVNLDGTDSFDYDGSIASYNWQFGDPNCTTNCESSSAVTSYTYPADQELYWAGLTVTDNDGNTHQDGIEVIVYPSEAIKQQNTKKKRLVDRDPEREQKKKILAQTCSKNRAPACYEVGKMHHEDGNQFAATKYFEKACALGYEAACSRK